MKRILWVLLIAIALFFALQGGEYSSRDLYLLKVRSETIQHDVDSLQREVDSLTRYLRAVKTDSATQERIAREEFGMVRGNREMLYRFGEPADTSKP
ncbi:MAG: septum formation initiator family protein [Gemmatimonadaceae bacterium]